MDGDLFFRQTCWACPEQYDVFRIGSAELVGHLRLRHGRFRAECPLGTVVYAASPRGDGVFEDDERHGFLSAAADAIWAALGESGPAPWSAHFMGSLRLREAPAPLNTNDYKMAPSGIGPKAAEWDDKPHRLVYDLCREVERLRQLRLLEPPHERSEQ